MAINNPLIPGDPFSYDLKWIVDKLKEAIALYQPLNEKFDDLSSDFDALGDEFTALKTYIENYFAGLDLTEEVRQIINELQASGYFDGLVLSIIQNDDGIQAYVTEWLEQHVTPVGAAVTVDTSLSVSGSAADALVTGRRTEDLKENAEHKTLFNGYYKQGFYGTTDGVYNGSRTDYFCADQAFEVDDYLLINLEDIREACDIVYIAWYDANMAYLSSTNVITRYDFQKIIPVTDGKFVRFSFHAANNYTYATAPSFGLYTDYAFFSHDDHVDIMSGVEGIPKIGLEPCSLNTSNFSLTYYAADTTRPEHLTVFTTPDPVYAPADFQIKTSGDLVMQVSLFTDKTMNANTFIGTIPGWQTAVYVRKGLYAMVSFARPQYPVLTKEYLMEHIHLITDLDSYFYGYEGAHINTKRGAKFIRNTWRLPTALGNANRQGLAYHSGKLFVFYGDTQAICSIVDYATGMQDSAFNIVGQHPNSAAFSGEYYDSEDPFPILYVCDWNANLNHVYKNRIDLSGATLLQTITLPQDVAGYYACGAVDAETNRLVVSGYTRQEPIDGTNNHVIITVWDLSSISQVGADYVPALIDRFELNAFYGAMQDRTVYNGKLFILNGLPSSNIARELHVIDLEKRKEVSTFKNWPSYLQTNEPQGLTVIPKENEDRFLFTYLYDSMEMALN